MSGSSMHASSGRSQTPASRQRMKRRCVLPPAAVFRRQVAPGGASPRNPEDGVDEFPVVLGDSAPTARSPGQERLDFCPHFVRKVVAVEPVSRCSVVHATSLTRKTKKGKNNLVTTRSRSGLRNPVAVQGRIPSRSPEKKRSCFRTSRLTQIRPGRVRIRPVFSKSDRLFRSVYQASQLAHFASPALHNTRKSHPNKATNTQALRSAKRRNQLGQLSISPLPHRCRRQAHSAWQ